MKVKLWKALCLAGLLAAVPAVADIVYNQPTSISVSQNYLDNIQLRFGTGNDFACEYDTQQTPDTMVCGVSSDSRGWVIMERADINTDMGHALQTNPTLFIHSADATDTTDWIGFAHNQTHAVVSTGGGNLNIVPASSTTRLLDSTATGGVEFIMAASGIQDIETIDATTGQIRIQNKTFTPGAAHIAFNVAPSWDAENFSHTSANLVASQTGNNSSVVTALNLHAFKTQAATTLAEMRTINIAATSVAGTLTSNSGLRIEDQSSAGGTSAFAINILSQTANATTTRAIEIAGSGINNAIRFGASANLWTNGANLVNLTDASNTRGVQWTLTAAGNQSLQVTPTNVNNSLVLQTATFTPGATHVATLINPTWSAENQSHTALSVLAVQDGANSDASGVRAASFGVQHTSAGTTTQMAGFILLAPVLTAGTITNYYGINILDQTVAGSTTSAAIRIIGTGVANSIRFGNSAYQYSSGAEDIRFMDSTNARGIALALTAAGNQTITATGGELVLNSTANLGVAGSSLGVLKFNGNTSGTVTVQSAAAAGTYTLTLPVNDGNASQFLQTDGGGVLSWQDVSSPTGANPTASVGLSAVNGVAATFMRSDGAPALDQSITPTWTGAHIFSGSALRATFTSTEDAASTQVAIFQGDRATMADNDEAYASLRLSNDGGTQTEVSRLSWVATDVNAATSVDGALDFSVMTAGTLTKRLRLVDTVFAVNPFAAGADNLDSGITITAGDGTNIDNFMIRHDEGDSELQFRFKANPASVTDLAEASYTEVLHITSAGVLQIGGSTSSLIQTTGWSLLVEPTATQASVFGATMIYSNRVVWDNSNMVASRYYVPYYSGPSTIDASIGAGSALIGFGASPVNNAGGTLPLAAGFWGRIREAGGGVITDAIIYGGENGSVSGTITNQYFIKIPRLTIGGTLNRGYHQDIQTVGTMVFLGADSAATMTGALIGEEFDFNTNVTLLSGSAFTGHRLSLPAFTQSSASTTDIIGWNLPVAGALIQNTAAGTINWTGFNLQMPDITQTTGAVNSYGLRITGAETLTSGTQYGLFVSAAASRFDGRILSNQGADIASATNITLGNDGNSFEITGTTKIDLIANTGWDNGAIVTLIANASVIIDHGTASSGANIQILLNGGGDFSMTVNDTLTIILSETTAGGQVWREVGRSVN